jgi:hypothetical protein
VEKVLPKAVSHDEALRAARAQAAMRDWEAIVGEGLAKRSRPDRYGKGTVWVAVTGSAWAQEMRMRKETILARLRERAGDPTLFVDVRFGVRPLPLPEASDERVEPEPSPAVERARESESVSEPPEAELSIREIARRRLARWRNDPPAAS